MKFATLSLTALVIALTLPATATAQAPPTQTPPAQEQTEAPAQTGVAGKWTMSVQSPQGATNAALEVKLDAEDPKKVTGTLVGPQGPVAFEGEYTEEAGLGFLISFDTAEGPFGIYFSGKLQEDGTLAGSADMGEMGQMSWTAKRAQ